MDDPILLPSILAGAVRFAVAFLLLAAALPKLRHPLAFTGVVANYRILPHAMTAPFARALPFVELLLAVLLAVPPLAGAASLVAASLLSSFAAAIAINIARGRSEIDCGCRGGELVQPLRPAMVWRNLALAALLAVSTLAPPLAPTSLAKAGASALALAAGAVFFLLGHGVKQIWAIQAAAHKRKTRG